MIPGCVIPSVGLLTVANPTPKSPACGSSSARKNSTIAPFALITDSNPGSKAPTAGPVSAATATVARTTNAIWGRLLAMVKASGEFPALVVGINRHDEIGVPTRLNAASDASLRSLSTRAAEGGVAGGVKPSGDADFVMTVDAHHEGWELAGGFHHG